ncbi:tubulin-specific chaperone a, putative [Plasmodium sp. DRC-Itaito]|nr:tubulin-specific chaperone a, putative [Plasmodium sp. DRC-Itaito]
MEYMEMELKVLKINHAAVRRLLKELIFYEEEEKELRGKLNTLKDENKSENEIKRAKDILEETVKVIPHINSSLQKSLKKLYETIYEKFPDILEINDKKVNISKKCTEEELKDLFTKNYEEFRNEINIINQTLENVFLHIKDVSLTSSKKSAIGEPVLYQMEECIDI